MKKICLMLCCVVLPLLVSCVKSTDRMYSTLYDIRATDWTEQDGYYSVTLDVEEITRQVVNYGSVQCFRVYDDGTQACLPLQRYLSYTYTVDGGTTETGYYSQMIDFEYNIGTVAVFYQTSDYFYETGPEAMTIRVVVHY